MNTLLPWNNQLLTELNHIINRSIQAIGSGVDQHCAAYPNSRHQLFSTNSGWAARVDLPGYSKEEINLKFEDHSLLLKAENETRGAKNLKLSLGEEVDTNGISARLENGILEILLPKKEAPSDQSHEIAIQ